MFFFKFIIQDDPTEEVELTQCTKGGYFGELALVTHKPRAASVYAVGDLVCAGRIREYLGNFLC